MKRPWRARKLTTFCEHNPACRSAGVIVTGVQKVAGLYVDTRQPAQSTLGRSREPSKRPSRGNAAPGPSMVSRVGSRAEFLGTQRVYPSAALVFIRTIYS